MSIILFMLSYITYSQTPENNFFDALIYGKEDISSFVDSAELVLSNRLGINYLGIKNKYLISYDIDENIKKEITEKKVEYNTAILETDGDYSKVVFSVTALNYSKFFYFRAGKYISPTTYYSRNWTVYTSKYFIFKISEPKYFNEYCIKKLDEFVEKMSDLLEYTGEEKQLLEEEKIYYILCKDEKEIKTVSGFDMRGQYLTAFDEILTTYNTHYHELCHFLINYKLKNLSLYTLPFFMEGFAVALGGRGGMSTRVVTDVGLYLQKKGILTYDSIIDNDAFYREDASLTYPVAGLYNLFLINKIGITAYLDLYKKVNGDLSYLSGLKAGDIKLPDYNLFEQYMNDYLIEKSVILNYGGNSLNLSKGTGWAVADLDTCYYFNVKGNIISLYPESNNINSEYKSRIYEEISKTNYNGENYLIKVDSSYIKVYNCYSNELLESYDVNFSLDSKTVPIVSPPFDPEERYFAFLIKKSMLDMDFSITK